MAVLVTGAAGFLGRHLAAALLDRGEPVVAFDVDGAGLAPLRESGAVAVPGDLGRWNDVVDAVAGRGVRCIFHCGALLSAVAEADPTAAYRANADGTYHVLEVARLLGVERVVFTSTMAVFGRGAGDPVDDDAPQWPTTIYGVTKVLGERLVEYHHGRYGLDARALRFPSVVGHGRGGSGASSYSSMAFDEPACGRPYALPVSPETRCVLLHVDDAVRALLGIGDADPSSLTRRVYNVSGVAPTAAELIEAVAAVVPGARLSFAPDEHLEAIVRSWPLALDDARARQDWGWRPQLDLPAIAARVLAEAQQAA